MEKFKGISRGTMNILLFGENGQVGSELQQSLPEIGKVISLKNFDLTNLHELQQTLKEIKPDLIVNASAYTAVDKAESEVDVAMKVNAQAPAIMAEWARKSGAGMIHYSTDYVFDGKKGSPYVESDLTNPLNVYGKSKLAGEENIQQAGDAYWIFRTSWVYSVRKTSFVSKVLEWARKNETLKIVNDQVSNPTWARDLADAIFRLISAYRRNIQDVMKEKRGIYHLAGTGYISRYEWAKQILANDPRPSEQLARSIEPVSSDVFPTPAIRPLFSALDCSKFMQTFGFSLPGWKDSLKKAMAEQKLEK
jgi:dTDP-4-dehydrorhamnose reductase